MTPRLLGAAVALLFVCSAPSAAIPEEWASWNDPVDPFRIAGNLYYVGTVEIAAYLITTPEGHILIDGGFEETAPRIRDAVVRLGFRLEDVRYLLNSHAHVDHAGGLARLKAWTGATLAASRRDAPLLRAGGDAEWPFPPVEPDRLLEDGATITLGDTVMTARVTSGHTPGCTSWTTRIVEKDRPLDVVFLCSVNVLPGMDLLTPDPAFPEGRDAAFRRAFDMLEAMPVDIFLGAHASFFLMDSKRKAMSSDPPNPFVDPALFRRHVERKRARFEEFLAEQQAARGAGGGPGTGRAE